MAAAALLGFGVIFRIAGIQSPMMDSLENRIVKHEQTVRYGVLVGETSTFSSFPRINNNHPKKRSRQNWKKKNRRSKRSP